jgi:hypothetical protein
MERLEATVHKKQSRVTEQLQLHFERNEAFVQLFAVGANNT